MLNLIVKYDSYYRNDAILSIMCVQGVTKKGCPQGRLDYISETYEFNRKTMRTYPKAIQILKRLFFSFLPS